jgi:GcrA cell cycle regulator
MSWTDDRVEQLKKMWGEGKSASQIAKELGSVTRNAVIGKVHRLGLSSRTSEGGAGEAAATADAAMAEGGAGPAFASADDAPDVEPALDAAEAPSAVPAENVVQMPGRRPIVPAGQPLPPQPSANEISPEALANVREVEKSARRLKLMELTERTCKWPIGDPATPEFWFCGLPVVPGKPYCEAHVAVAFQPMQARRDRRR